MSGTTRGVTKASGEIAGDTLESATVDAYDLVHMIETVTVFVTAHVSEIEGDARRTESEGGGGAREGDEGARVGRVAIRMIHRTGVEGGEEGGARRRRNPDVDTQNAYY
mmetsp:Transcript_30795/g.49384  ORF Transcript_30795/g.49384 Transcript_30795/m.49384 type:complete len:109 (+) Transcript_30795:244-570(+)